MKNFLSKKPAMITFVVLAVVFLAVYIGMLVRPVSYGFNYVHKETDTYGDITVTTTSKLNVKSDKYAHAVIVSEVNGEKEEMEVDIWIYRDGNYVFTFGDMAVKEFHKFEDMTEAEIAEMNKTAVVTEEEYRAMVKELEELKKTDKVAYNTIMEEGAYKTNAFRMEMGKNEDGKVEYAQNTQAIVFAVVHGVVTVALLTFAGLAIAFTVKKKA